MQITDPGKEVSVPSQRRSSHHTVSASEKPIALIRSEIVAELT